MILLVFFCTASWIARKGVVVAQEDATSMTTTTTTTTMKGGSEEDDQCSIYIAPSTYSSGYGYYYAGGGGASSSSSTSFPALTPLHNHSDPVHMLINHPWHDWTVLQSLVESPLNSGISPMYGLYEAHHRLDILNSRFTCHAHWYNMIQTMEQVEESEGCQPSSSASNSNPNFGAQVCYHTPAPISTRTILPGEELILYCEHGNGYFDEEEEVWVVDNDSTNDEPPELVSTEWLTQHGTCADHLYIVDETEAAEEEEDDTTHTKQHAFSLDLGRGVRTRRSLQKGQVVAMSPVVHIDRVDLEHEPANAEYAQPLLNYVYGPPGSHYVLWPTDPIVNMINHYRIIDGGIEGEEQQEDGDKTTTPNVELQWFNGQTPSFWEEVLAEEHGSASDRLLRETDSIVLNVQYVATRDIAAGEAITMDYGPAWEAAWKDHVQAWYKAVTAAEATSSTNQQVSHDDVDDEVTAMTFSFSAAEYNEAYRLYEIATEEEQLSKPYPSHLETACFFQQVGTVHQEKDVDSQFDSDEDADFLESRDENGLLVYDDYLHFDCLRPCRIVDRYPDESKTAEQDGEDAVDSTQSPPQTMLYTAIMGDPLVNTPTHCRLHRASPEEEIMVGYIPRDRILLAHKADTYRALHGYSRRRAGDTAELDDNAESTPPPSFPIFRHEIGIPDAFDFPESWMKQHVSVRPVGFIQDPPLKVGEIERLKLDTTGEEPVEWGFRMGIPPTLKTELLEYATKNGIVDEMKRRVVHGDPLPAGGQTLVDFGGKTWWETRFRGFWRTNMHYVTPASDDAMDDYLKALARGGFDTVLESIGKRFNLDGLMCYYMSFIAVSHTSKGHIHADYDGSYGKGFNLIFPVMLANETGPELDLRADDESVVAGYRYTFDEANIVGDDAYHGTASCDYRGTGQMRLVASIYMADVNPDNIHKFWTGEEDPPYPPRDGVEGYFLERMGTHWNAKDPSMKLPQ